MEEIGLENSIEKPDFFWHGSTKGDIEEFEPRTSHGTGTELGPRVYATPDKTKALPFLASEYIDSTWQTSVINGEVFVFIPMSQEEFMQRDQGGYLYKLPSTNFEKEPEGMGWSSARAVAPVEKEYIPKVFSAMQGAGISVYFITPEQMSSLQEVKQEKEGELAKWLKHEGLEE